MSLSLLKTIKGVQLPKDTGKPDQPAYPAEPARVTSWALAGMCTLLWPPVQDRANLYEAAITRASSSISSHITLQKPPIEPKNMIDLRTGVKNGAVRFRNLDPGRVQNADAVMIHVYGTERKGTDACGNCQKALGPFTTCVQLVKNGACSNCHYNSGASGCSLKRTQKRTGSPALTTPRKLKISRAEADFLVMQLRVLGNALVGVADKLNEVGYDPNTPMRFPEPESEDEDEE
ncbi:hypothetical protein CSUB01_08325 [Colletotrichum sublineola]|uniref:Uncharacterized protein n=1 Tax=Colletotrichum sublineola TaxID=1173701 RepID=A0A066XSM1_COLSU|nr:hypothetical protein CSUB01_08325 [Colletotrichum sublineola]